MKFEFEEEVCIASDGLINGIFEGDIMPSDILVDSQQIKLLEEAISLVESFAEQLEDSGIVEEY